MDEAILLQYWLQSMFPRATVADDNEAFVSHEKIFYKGIQSIERKMECLTIPRLTSPALNEICYVKHGFFTRLGGIGQGCFAELNTSLKDRDDVRSVYENRRRICQTFNLSLEDLGVVDQRHTNIVHVITKPFLRDDIPVGDALITSTPNVLIGVKTADCVPILLADQTQPLVAAIHAGWRGAVGGIIENTLRRMNEMGAKSQNIVAALGPCIWQESFEVDRSFVETFKGSEQFFVVGKHRNHYQFDLPGYVISRLKKTGVAIVSPSPADTFTDEKNFFSCRRKTVKNELDFGNQMSVICIDEERTQSHPPTGYYGMEFARHSH